MPCEYLVNTEDNASDAVNVVDLVWLNTKGGVVDAKIVVDLAYICEHGKRGNSAACTKPVVDLACVSTENGVINVKIVVDLACVRTEDTTACTKYVQSLW